MDEPTTPTRKEVATVATEKTLQERVEASRQRTQNNLQKMIDKELVPQIEAAQALAEDAGLRACVAMIEYHAIERHRQNLAYLRHSLATGRTVGAPPHIMYLSDHYIWENRTIGFAQTCVDTVNMQYDGQIPPIELCYDEDEYDDTYICIDASPYIEFAELPVL